MTVAPANPPLLTPPAVARQLGVKPQRVVGWIRSGVLRAVNLSDKQRPRFKVSPVDLQVFLDARAVTPPVRPTRRRRSASIIEFF